jgi:hypothetical protein
MALGAGGRRYQGLERRPAWQAFSQAYQEETGRRLPLPSGTLKIGNWHQDFERCTDEHSRRRDAIIALFRRSVPF